MRDAQAREKFNSVSSYFSSFCFQLGHQNWALLAQCGRFDFFGGKVFSLCKDSGRAVLINGLGGHSSVDAGEPGNWTRIVRSGLVDST